MRGRRAFAAAVLIVVAGCAPVDILNATIPHAGLTIVRDVPYATGPMASDPRMMMDVYRPVDVAGRLPVIVFIYGGAWRTGDRGDYLFAAAALARQGNVVMVPDYRRYPAVHWPDFVSDNARAVAHAEQVAASWGGDPDRLFVIGHSAGAYDVAMLALDRRYLEAAGGSRDKVDGFVGLAGPYDFAPITDRGAREVFSPSPDDPAKQPISYVDGTNRPMLLLAGADDRTVMPRNTLSLAAKIQADGGPVQSKVYPDLGHVGIVLALTPRFDGRAPVLTDIERFIRTTPPLPEF